MKKGRKPEMENIIEVENVSKSFGGVKANIDISLKLRATAFLSKAVDSKKNLTRLIVSGHKYQHQIYHLQDP